MRHSLSAAFLAFVLAHTGVSAPAATAQTVADIFAPARQQLLHHDYAAASASYKRGLKRQTGTARDYYQAARAAARNQEPKQALDWLAQAVAKGYYAEADLQMEEDFTALATQPTWALLLTRARIKQQQHEAPFNQALVTLLKNIFYQDQRYRLAATAAERKYGSNSPQIGEIMRYQERLDAGLSKQIDSLITQQGYPGKSVVGEYQKDVAFLVIQHSPNRKYLPLLTAAAEKGEMSWSALALFIDRLQTERGQPQVYGSQVGAAVNGPYTLDPIEDEPHVNVRRAKIGLEPLEEYLLQFGLAYQVPTATHNPNPPMLYTSPTSSTASVEESPVELIGGYKALKAQLRYPAAAQAKQVQGNVTLQLRIDKAGIPQDVAVVEGLGYGCDEEALRVMRTARYRNAAGQDHEIRLTLPFPYVPTGVEEE
jgi:TonB family protein